MPCRSKKMNIMKVYIHIYIYMICYFIILYAHCANIPPLASSTFTSFHAYALQQGFHFDNPTDAESNPRVWTIIVYLRTMIHSHVTWEVYTPSGCGKLSIYSHPSVCRIIYAEIPFLEWQFVIKRIVLLQWMPATKCKNDQQAMPRSFQASNIPAFCPKVFEWRWQCWWICRRPSSFCSDRWCPQVFPLCVICRHGGQTMKKPCEIFFCATPPRTTGRNLKTAPFRTKKPLKYEFL